MTELSNVEKFIQGAIHKGNFDSLGFKENVKLHFPANKYEGDAEKIATFVEFDLEYGEKHPEFYHENEKGFGALPSILEELGVSEAEFYLAPGELIINVKEVGVESYTEAMKYLLNLGEMDMIIFGKTFADTEVDENGVSFSTMFGGFTLACIPDLLNEGVVVL